MPVYRRATMMAAADAMAAAPSPEASYQAGDMKFTATVRAEFELASAP
jgi:uncharacterized protein YggE